jgi:hypothetical protein
MNSTKAGFATEYTEITEIESSRIKAFLGVLGDLCGKRF